MKEVVVVEWVYLIILVFFVFGGGDALLKHHRQLRQFKIEQLKEQRKLEQEKFEHERALQQQKFEHDQQLYEQYRLRDVQLPQLGGTSVPPPARQLPDVGLPPGDDGTRDDSSGDPDPM